MLAPGESAGATLTYTRPDGPEDVFPAAFPRVTPPDERTTLTLTWTALANGWNEAVTMTSFPYASVAAGEGLRVRAG